DLLKSLAQDELHGVEVDTRFFADGKDGHDVAVMQGGCGTSLAAEALQLVGQPQGGERQNLDCHTTSERLLLGFVDDPHPAPADFANEAKFAEPVRRRSGPGISA